MSWVFDKPFSFDEPNFSRIFRFFVIETPVEKCSIRGIPLQYYGWNSKKITNHLKKQITSLSKNWKTIPSKESSKIESIEQDIQKLCNKNKILDEVAERKEVFIHTDMKKTKLCPSFILFAVHLHMALLIGVCILANISIFLRIKTGEN